jgi:hypothetical protein
MDAMVPTPAESVAANALGVSLPGASTISW